MIARSFHIEDQLVRRLILATYLQGEQAVYVNFDLNGDRRSLLGTTSRSCSDIDALLSALPSRHKSLQFRILSACAGDGGSRCLEVSFLPVPFQVEPLGFVTIHPFETVGSLQEFVDSQWYGAQGSTHIYAGGHSPSGFPAVGRRRWSVAGSHFCRGGWWNDCPAGSDQGVPDAPFLVKTFVQRAGMKRVAAILTEANTWSAFRTLCTELNIAVSTASSSAARAVDHLQVNDPWAKGVTSNKPTKKKERRKQRTGNLLNGQIDLSFFARKVVRLPLPCPLLRCCMVRKGLAALAPMSGRNIVMLFWEGP